jgi:hypothetical protein
VGDLDLVVQDVLGQSPVMRGDHDVGRGAHGAQISREVGQ